MLARRALTLASSAFAGDVGPHASTIAELTTYGAGLRVLRLSIARL